MARIWSSLTGRRVRLMAAAEREDAVPGMFECPCCGMRSTDPRDVQERYCGACHWWTGIPGLLAQRPKLVEMAAQQGRCAGCDEPIGDGDHQVQPQVRWRRIHLECQALQMLGHDFGVCSCTGHGSARASARLLWGRLQAAEAEVKGGEWC